MDFAQFKHQVRENFGLDLDGYKEPQLKRRIESLMTAQGAGQDYQRYLELLQGNLKQKQLFLDKITINVSEFFRNPEIFMLLEKEVIPSLLKKSPRLKVWSAACSNGSEPYSVAIILDEITPGPIHRIEATDLDKKILEQAQLGEYSATAIRNISPERLKKYFQERNGVYTVNPTIRERVSYRHHDLLVHPYGTGYDLIICRNVTIYFTKETQDRLYRQFYTALRPGGILFIGATESLLQYKQMGFAKNSPWFYQKV
ncbi:MAG: CheR family methyltransferase [Bacillota bacterium]